MISSRGMAGPLIPQVSRSLRHRREQTAEGRKDSPAEQDAGPEEPAGLPSTPGESDAADAAQASQDTETRVAEERVAGGEQTPEGDGPAETPEVLKDVPPGSIYSRLV